jgi:ATP-binding cassette subfamily B multidrug efflux pump
MADEEQNKPKKPDDELSGKVYDSRLMRRLGHYLRPYWWQAAVSALSVSLKSLCDVTGPYLVMVAIDRYFPLEPGAPVVNLLAHGLSTTKWLARHLPTDPYQGISRLALIFLCAQLAAYLFEFIQIYLMQWTGQKLMFDLRRDIFRHMQRMHIGFFDTHSVGRLVTRITSDVDAINEMFTAGVLAIVDDFLNLAIMAALMLTINWRLALLAFSVLPLILIVTRLFRDHVRESYRRVRTAIGRINSFSQEYISGMSVVQLFNREQRAFDDFAVVNRQHLVAFKDTIFAYALFYPAVDLLSIVAIALVVSRGGFGVISGAVTIGVLNMFIQYSLRFWRPIQDMSDKYNILQSAMAASERIFRLLDTQPEIVSPAQPLAGDGSNRIEFRHVWFTYQKLTEQQKAAVKQAVASESHAANLAAIDGIEWILKDVSFTVEPGQSVAIVGHTGAGKTTLTSLMMRFYDVTAGQILIDGIDIREHDLTALRQHFAVVLQDPFLFTGTLAENIRFGNERITQADLRQAARDVNVLDFIESLPQEAARKFCSRTGIQSPHSHPRRSYIERGHRHRAAHTRRAGAHGRGPDKCSDCPPPLDRAARR